MAFKMNYNKDNFPYKNMGPTKHGKYDGPSFNAELRKEAMDPDTTMNEGFKEKVLSSNTMKTHMYKHGGTKPQSQMTQEELAEHKGIKNPQSTRTSQGDFEPMFEGADISQEQFDKMSKKEQEEYRKQYS